MPLCLIKKLFPSLFAILLFLNLIEFGLAPLRAYSSSNGVRVIGKVYALDTKLPLPTTNIIIEALGMGTTSDSSGKYSIMLEPGSYEITFQYIGYKTEKRKIEVFGNEESIELNVYLQLTVIPGEEVFIIAPAEEPKITRYELPPAKLITIANPLPDALISLKTLPGVFSGNDQSTFYNVRGGNYDENLIYLNGVEIYQPILVRKGITENPSLVNPYLIQSINLRTGAFPVNYGDKLSSVLDITYREGNPDRISSMAALSTIKTELFLEGPVNKKSTWVLGMRKINYGYLFNALQTKGNYSPDFKDIQLGLTWQPDSLNKVKLFGLYGDSQFKLSPKEWSSDWELADTEVQHMYLNGQESFTYQSSAIGLQWYHQVTKKLQTNIGLSYFNQQEHEDSHVAYSFRPFRLDSGRMVPDTSTLSFPDRVETFNNKLNISLTRLLVDGKYSLSRQHQFRFGFELKSYRFKDRLYQVVEDSTKGETDPAQPIATSDVMNSVGFSAYGEYCWQPSGLFYMKAGMRFTEYEFNKEPLLMPRISLVYHLTERTDVILASGLYTQPALYKEFRYRGTEQITSLKAQKSTQVTLGLEHQWAGNMSFRLEAYYKRLCDLISYELWDVRTVYSGRNDAVGYVYGLDVHLRGDFIPDCLAWLSYSYLVAREDLDYDTEKWVPRPSDQRHAFAATLQDKMERFPGSRMHIRLLFGSGYPYTYRIVRINDEGERIIKMGRRNAQRIPFYRRFDIGFSQKFTLFNSVNITLREEILNLFDEYNVLGYSWLNGVKIEHGLSRRTFNIGMQIEF